MNRATLIALLVTSACGPSIRPLDPKEIEDPALLVDTSEIVGDFSATQRVHATFGRPGSERKALFLAVIQKSGAKLTIVALTPQGQRAFVLTQVGTEVSFDIYPGAELPFSPWHILVDIHRGIFRGGGPTLASKPDGRHRVAHAAEPMVETWKRGALVRREIFAHDMQDAVTIDYTVSGTVDASAPLYLRTVRYRNNRVGYKLEISPSG